MTSPLWRLSGVVGIAAAAVLALGSLAMAATQEGTVTITPITSTTGTATWTWTADLSVGEYVSVYAYPTGNPSSPTALPAYNGDVTTQGEYTTSTITLPPGDTWSNTGIEMQEANFSAGQLPEVPWAAGIPLIMVLPWAFSAWRHRAQN